MQAAEDGPGGEGLTEALDLEVFAPMNGSRN
jgi:hypothetical protein